MQKENFIYKGFDYSYMDDAGKAIMKKKIAQDLLDERKEENAPKGLLKEIWERINNHGDYTWLAKRGLLEKHIAKCKSQYSAHRRLQPLVIYQGAEINPNTRNLNIIENEIDKD